jgi:fucose permease
MVIPPVMGLIADWWSVTVSFVVLGILLLLLCIPIVWISRRAAATPRAAVEEAPEPT